MVKAWYDSIHGMVKVKVVSAYDGPYGVLYTVDCIEKTPQAGIVPGERFYARSIRLASKITGKYGTTARFEPDEYWLEKLNRS